MTDNEKQLEDIINKGLSAFYREDHAKAEEVFLEALKLNSENAQVNYQLGSACYYQGRVDEAIGYYKKAVELAPDDPHYHFVFGFALMANDSLREAAEHLEKSISIDDSDSQVHRNLGEVYYLSGEYEKSAGALKIVMAMDPLAENFLYYYISTRKSGREDEARQIIEKANKAIGRDDSLYMIIRLYMGFIDTEMLQNKIGERVMPCTLYYHCGMSMLFEGKKDMACDFFQKAVDTKLYYITEHKRSRHELDACGR